MQGIFKDLAHLREHADENGYVSGEITIELQDIIDGDLENLLDELSERLIGSICGSDIQYECKSITPDGTIRLEVTVDASMELDNDEDEDNDDDE